MRTSGWSASAKLRIEEPADTSKVKSNWKIGGEKSPTAAARASNGKNNKSHAPTLRQATASGGVGGLSSNERLAWRLTRLRGIGRAGCSGAHWVRTSTHADIFEYAEPPYGGWGVAAVRLCLV